MHSAASSAMNLVGTLAVTKIAADTSQRIVKNASPKKRSSMSKKYPKHQGSAIKHAKKMNNLKLFK